jgi:hypothetical protein
MPNSVHYCKYLERNQWWTFISDDAPSSEHPVNRLGSHERRQAVFEGAKQMNINTLSAREEITGTNQSRSGP